MRSLFTPLLGIVVFLGGRPACAQEIKKPAELMPAKTLAYLELRQPGALVKEVARLLEDSYLADVPESLAPLKAKFPVSRRRGPEEMSLVGLMFTPEVIRELSRVQGAAVAITGLDKDERGMPEFVVVVQPGESNMPGFMTRMFMAAFAYGGSGSDGKTRTETRGGFERVGDVEGVGLYRNVDRTFKISQKDGRPLDEGKVEPRISGPALALLPDLIVFGSTELVKGVIRRAKGKGNGPALATVDAFQRASKDWQAKPGLVAFANPAAVMDLLHNVDLGREGRSILKVVESVVNPKAFVAVADQLTLENATLKYTRRVYLDPKETCPLLDVLPRAAAPRTLLHFVPDDSLGFVLLANDDGDKRFKRILELADGVAKALGEANVPSQGIGKLEEALGLELGKDIAGKIRGLALAAPGPKQLMEADARKAPPVLLLVDVVDAEAAAELAKSALPKLFSLIAHEKDVIPTDQIVAGHQVFTLESKRGNALSYGSVENTLVLGVNQKTVAQALTAGQKKKGLLGNAKFAQRMDDLRDPIAVAMIRPMTLASFYVAVSDKGAPAPDKEVTAPKAQNKFEERRAVQNEAGDKRAQQLMEIVSGEEPLLLSISRAKDQMTADITYPGLRPLVARLTNFLLEEYVRDQAHERRPRPVEEKREK